MLSNSARRARGASVSSIRNIQAGFTEVGSGAVRVAEAALRSDIQPGVFAVTAGVANQALPGPGSVNSHNTRQPIRHSHESSALIEEVEAGLVPHRIEAKREAVKDADITVQQIEPRSSTEPVSVDALIENVPATTKDKAKAVWRWFLTPTGFLLTLYGLNIVAWGGMLFLLLCGASPAMCWYTDSTGQSIKDCDSNESPRKIWIEIDSQILNALFCVTGLGLIPWRARDLYYLLSYRLTSRRRCGAEKKMFGLKMLASHYRGWIRLPLQDQEPDVKEDTQVPLILIRPTATWKIDVFVWCQVANTLFQIGLCYWMCAYNRYNRPPWATGLFVGLACGAAGIGGFVSYLEGRRVKREEAAAQAVPV